MTHNLTIKILVSTLFFFYIRIFIFSFMKMASLCPPHSATLLLTLNCYRPIPYQVCLLIPLTACLPGEHKQAI